MRITREMGQTGPRRAVENAHRDLSGRFESFSVIAARLYDKHGSARQVREEIERLYSQRISEKTASDWINRGQALLAASDAPAPDREPVAA